jgi:hypothetical protein
MKAIHKKFGSVPLKTFPYLGVTKGWYYMKIKGLKTYSPLNWIDYDKGAVKKFIQEELGWRDYGGKHYESIFTKFYQAYILPVKFKVDKRRAHLSNLICSGQLSREAALEELEIPLYDSRTLSEEKTYVLKKLGMTEAEFDQVMADPPRKHEDFKTEKPLWDRYFRIVSMLKLKA